MKMNLYNAYGLGIHSTMPLPELTPLVEADHDVLIRRGKVGWSPPTQSGGEATWFSEEEAYLRWDQVGTFLVRAGKEIIVDPLPGIEESLIRLPLLGAVLAVLLHQRGWLVLHASAVEIDDQAVAFVGAKGLGKSTTAAMLYSWGHRIIADDIVAVDLTDKTLPLVRPGFPQIKLWPEAAAAIGDDPEALAQLSSGINKRIRSVADRFSQRFMPLGCICVLGWGSALQLKLLGPQEALPQLIGQSYISRFGKRVLHGRVASEHLKQCASIISSAPVFMLERPEAVDLLPAAARLVQEKLQSLVTT